MDTTEVKLICCLNVTLTQRQILKDEFSHFTSLWPKLSDTEYRTISLLIDDINKFPHFFFKGGEINCFVHSLTFEPELKVIAEGIYNDSPVSFDEFVDAIKVYIINNKIYPYEHRVSN